MDELEPDDHTDSAAGFVPAYSSDEMRETGERLAELYRAARAGKSDDAAEEIARLRATLRRGPRMHPGEFLAAGRYRLLDRLHRSGGNDGYWRAHDVEEGRLVFAQVYYGEWVSDENAVDAFLKHGGTLAGLVHPHIGRVLAAHQSDDGFVYLITDLFESNLEAIDDLDTVAALQVVVECAHALQHAHSHGVIHGDLQPSNVMLSPDGAAHVVGFTLTPMSTRETSLFRAPESTERDYEPSPTSDVYALGMTAMRALSGAELPFWVLRDPGRLIDGLAIEEPVKDVLRRAVEWDLDARYDDPLALLVDLLADPALVEALAMRAREGGRFDVAAMHYETLLSIQPERGVEIRTILGDVYTAVGEYDPAFTHLLAALERTDDVESLFAPLRTVADRTQDWERLAQGLWTQAREQEPGRRVILRAELARIYQHELQQPSAAAETWAEVLDDHRSPAQAATALRAMQGLARDRGDWAAFVDIGQELLSYTPEDEQPRVEYAIGRAYLEHLDDEDQGLGFIDRAESAGWSEADLGPQLQTIRARHGQWQQVIQLMAQQAEDQDIAEASPTLLRAGIIASSVHLEEEAFKVYHALLERAPRHVVALRHLARLHHRAHEHDKALGFYERLWETYKGKEVEEPEASERAADCTAYALLLLRRGHAEAGSERLNEALRLNPNHVPSLQLAGPLLLARGQTADAGAAFERLMSLFKSVELSPQKIEACLGMGDLCWIQGRLTAAMGWYNRSIELDPFAVTGWWGLAKVAMSARGGHAGADRAPWVKAVPKRYTSNEGLARLIAGALDPQATRAWLQRSPLGKAMLEGGDTPMRMACLVVDLMLRNEVITPDLFRRLADARSGWAGPIDDVQRLWFAGGASTFPVPRSYGWSSRYIEMDFDEDKVRAVLPPELPATPAALPELKDPDAWKALLSGAQPEAPPVYEVMEANNDGGQTLHPGPIGRLSRDGASWLTLGNEHREAFIGRGSGGEMMRTDLSSSSAARLYRQGGRVYIEALSDEPLSVDGLATDRWRLVGGERVAIAELELLYDASEDGRRPPRARGSDSPPFPFSSREDSEVVRSAASSQVAATSAAVASDLDPQHAVAVEVDDGAFEPTIPLAPAPVEGASAVKGALAFGDGLGPDDEDDDEPETAPEGPPEDSGSWAVPVVVDRRDDPSPAPSAAPDGEEDPGWLKDVLAAEQAVDQADELSEEGLIQEASDPSSTDEDLSTLLANVIDPSLNKGDEAGSFGFPEEVASEDVSDLVSDPPAAVVGVTGPAASPELPAAYLEFLSGADRGSRIDIGDALSVGQSRQCGLSIPNDTRLSPTHCVVLATDQGHYILRDEGSTNGTVVNSKRVSEIPLAGGEVIMVGRTVLRFRMESEA